MTNNNNLYDLPKTATISYYDVETGQNLTVEEWNQLNQNNSSEIIVINKSGSNFISEKEGYGPCGDNYDCSCKCKWKSGCSCRFKWDEVGSKGRGDCDMDVRNGSLKGRIGWDGIEVAFEESKSAFRWKDSREEVKCFSGSVGGSARLDLDGVSLEKKLGYDLVNYKNKNGFKARAGFNIDTGGSISKEGVEAKLGGFGLSVGKKMGVSTPFGGISKDGCVIQ